MGKPFKQELTKLPDTIEWVKTLDLESLHKAISTIDATIYFVGSGGSMSACLFGVSLAEEKGIFAKAVTPLELYNSKRALRGAVVILVSASGKNNDILFGFKTAVRFEAKRIICLCMRTETKLSDLSKKYSLSDVYEFDLPVGKDGFLATNSLLAYFCILSRVFKSEALTIEFPDLTSMEKIKSFCLKLGEKSTITVLFSGWSKSVCYDIESKSIEAALYPILLSDYRNFGHGRHHWFAKKQESTIIALATPEDLFLAEKTLDALPENIPQLLLTTQKSGALGAIELLIKVFYLVDDLGESVGIDPGRPGVPPFGRKLYNLKYSTELKRTELDLGLSSKAYLAISRKCRGPIENFKKNELKSWEKAYKSYVDKLNKAHFGALIFDYDGTLCSSERKFEGPENEMASKLNLIAEQGFYLGVVTGRGKSVRKDLQKIIKKEYWSQVILGYYNGSVVGALNDDSLPNLNFPQNQVLKDIMLILQQKDELQIQCTLRPTQLTIEFNDDADIKKNTEIIVHTVNTSVPGNVQILESSHSIDIIPTQVSKINIHQPLIEQLQLKGLPTDLLCIGDRGLWPGNDYRLLETEYSLSVFEVSNDRNSCWNFAPAGVTHTDATLQYLQWLQIGKRGMKLKISK